MYNINKELVDEVLNCQIPVVGGGDNSAQCGEERKILWRSDIS